jgi:hypothetical protein
MSLDNETTYIASSCYVEYKKGISYEIDILFDKTGAITEAQCECPAGEGPDAHCKHVCTVVYGAIMFTKNKEIKAEQTCTDNLQSFHKCKRFLGSPLRSQNLDMSGADEITNIDFDVDQNTYGMHLLIRMTSEIHVVVSLVFLKCQIFKLLNQQTH